MKRYNEKESPLSMQGLRAECDVKTLLADIRSSVTGSSRAMTRLFRDHRTVACIWDGQTVEGVKVSQPGKARVGPWERASDAVVRTADTVIREMTSVCLASQLVAQVDVIPLAGTPPERTGAMQALMSHYLHGPMRAASARALVLSCRYAHAYGASVMRVEWRTRYQVEPAEITGEEIMSMVMEMAAQSMEQQESPEGEPEQTEPPEAYAAQLMETEADLRSILTDQERTDELIDMLQGYDPDMSEKEARRVARQLQDAPGFDTSVPYFRRVVKGSHPVWRLLRPGVNFFCPPETEDIQENWAMESHWFSGAEVKERALEEGWDEEWVEEVLKHPGRVWADMLATNAGWVLGGAGIAQEPAADWAKDRFQIFEVFYRPMTDADAPAVFRAVIHAGVGDKVGLHEVYDRAHMKLPYIAYTPLEDAQAIMDCRSVTEIVRTEQHQQKHQVDGWRDMTSLRVSPPLSGPITEASGSNGPRLSPGMYLGRVMGPMGGGYDFLQPPSSAGEAQVIMQESRLRIAQYFGLAHPEVASSVQMAMGQLRIDGWLNYVSNIIGMTGQLIQQFTDDSVASMVVGMPASVQSPAEFIRGEYMFRFSCDVQNMDPEQKEKKLEQMLKIMQLDTEAVADRGKLFQRLFAQFDPALAAAVLKDPAAATQDEAEDEQRNVVAMLAGMEPAQKKGQNHQLRAQILMQQWQQNPVVQAAMEQNETVAAIYEARMKFHQQEVDQSNNAAIGRNEGGEVMGGPMGVAA